MYFVPFGDFPAATTEALATYYQGKYGLAIGTLLPVTIPATVVDAQRRQLVAEKVLALMLEQHGEVGGPRCQPNR